MTQSAASYSLHDGKSPAEYEIRRQFLRSLARSRHEKSPFDYWLLENALPDVTVREIAALPVSVPTGMLFYGKREVNNAARIYFSPENQRTYDVCAEMAKAFRHPEMIAALSEETGSDLSKGMLRIEYCQDTDGFWLEPHVDISVKLFTMLIYLSDDPALCDAGTDIYDDTPEHNIVATAQYEKNRGMIFIPGKNTWHGFSKRPIKGIRKSIIINYVTPEWRDKWELA